MAAGARETGVKLPPAGNRNTGKRESGATGSRHGQAGAPADPTWGLRWGQWQLMPEEVGGERRAQEQPAWGAQWAEVSGRW